METRLVGLEQVPSITVVASRGNELLGKEVPGNPGYIIIKIVHVQVIPQPGGYDALLQVEVDQQEPLNLKAADVEAIVELTSTIEAPEETRNKKNQ